MLQLILYVFTLFTSELSLQFPESLILLYDLLIFDIKLNHVLVYELVLHLNVTRIVLILYIEHELSIAYPACEPCTLLRAH